MFMAGGEVICRSESSAVWSSQTSTHKFLSRPSFSADWGDYVSFAKHLRDRADADGSDLILVDTGDRVEGNGLYDASEPKGEYTFDIAKEQQIDLICSGNHELYKANSSNNEYYKTVPNFKENYIASNLDIHDPETGEVKPLAQRFRKFTTKNQGIRILAFGFIFDFTDNANNTIIQPVEETVKEDWFQEAIRDKELDLIVVIGHVAIRSKEYDAVFKAIRSVKWDIPIQFFGGHHHIRDYRIFDKKSTALASGRYMETIGFLSIKGINAGSKSLAKGLEFSRRYIDNNLYSLQHHSGKDEKSFPTEHGRNVTNAIQTARTTLNLDKLHGCSPEDFWVNRVPYPHEQSLFSLLEQLILPEQLQKSSRAKDGKKALAITNTGAMRFDIFKGPFTKDSVYLVSPFTSGIHYVKDVPLKVAHKLLSLLNNEGPIVAASDAAGLPDLWMLAPPEQLHRGRAQANEFSRVFESVWSRFSDQIQLHDDKNLIPGYTTKDDAGSDGDDTKHSPIKFYDVPNCIQAPIGYKLTDDELPEVVDVVYNEFLEKWILLALEYLGEKHSVNDTAPYIEGQMMTDVITNWISRRWSVDGNKCP